MPDLLIEIGCEDLPAVACREAERQIPGLLADGLDRARAGSANTVGVHVSPRRIAAIATGMPAERAAKRQEMRGPKADAPEQARAGLRPKARADRRRPGRARRPDVGHLRRRAAPVDELVPELVAGMRRGDQLLEVDALGSRPLLASGAMAGRQGGRSDRPGRAVRPRRHRHLSWPPLPRRPGGDHRRRPATGKTCAAVM